MVYAQPKICPGEWHKQTPYFDIQTYHLISARRPDNKENLQNCRFCCHIVKLKENEKKNKYLDLARELKKLRNMKMAVIQIVIGMLGTVTKGLIKRLEDL